MPYSVWHLIENQSNVVCVDKDDPVLHALDLMIEGDFSQLPVLDKEGRLLGMITYESTMRAVRSFNTKPDLLSVRDALINAPVHFPEDDLFDLLDELKTANAVVIIGLSKEVVGIVTSFDANRFLRHRTEDLMHIEEIEFTIKELIKRAYTDPKGELDYKKLTAMFEHPEDSSSARAGNRKPRTFESLTLVDYIHLLIQKETWEFFAPILKIEKDALLELLEKVRITRNDLVHFRGEISAKSRDELRYCANWLKSRYQEYEKELARISISGPSKPVRKPKSEKEVREQPEGYAAVSDHRPGGMKFISRYTALADWLSEREEAQVSLPFEELEAIIGSPLPESARRLRAWWANERIVGQASPRFWLEAGWKVIYVNLEEGLVVFARALPGEIEEHQIITDQAEVE